MKICCLGSWKVEDLLCKVVDVEVNDEEHSTASGGDEIILTFENSAELLIYIDGDGKLTAEID